MDKSGIIYNDSKVQKAGTVNRLGVGLQKLNAPHSVLLTHQTAILKDETDGEDLNFLQKKHNLWFRGNIGSDTGEHPQVFDTQDDTMGTGSTRYYSAPRNKPRKHVQKKKNKPFGKPSEVLIVSGPEKAKKLFSREIVLRYGFAFLVAVGLFAVVFVNNLF